VLLQIMQLQELQPWLSVFSFSFLSLFVIFYESIYTDLNFLFYCLLMSFSYIFLIYAILLLQIISSKETHGYGKENFKYNKALA